MPKIADQHAWKDSHYIPSDKWSDETLVQWGGNGVVLGKNSYKTAFFEAFPPNAEDAGNFIRGEGPTIQEAENSALQKYLRGRACDHLWGREHYRNGGQLCRHCRAFRSGVLPEIMTLGEWRRPLRQYEVMILDIHDDDDDNHDNDHDKNKGDEDRIATAEKDTPYIRKLRLRRRIFGEEPKSATQ